MDPDPAKDFSAFTVVAACLRDRTVEERQAMLQGLGLERHWAGIQSHWAHVLLDDVGRGDLSRMAHFQQACAHDRARRMQGDDAYAAMSSGQPMNLDRTFASIPVTRVGLHRQPDIETMVPSITMECEPAQHPAESEVEIQGPGTLEFTPQPPRPEHTTLIPDKPQKLTARSAADPRLESTRQAARWSVEKYAAFSASLSMRPDGAEEVAAEFDVIASAVDTIVELWQRKLDADPALKASYLVHYEASLQHRKPTR